MMKKPVILILLLLFLGCIREEDVNGPENGQGVVYFGLMVHLEGWDNEMDNSDQFENHAAAARTLADVFEDHGGKVTFETGTDFVMGCRAWNQNVLRELYNRGHGIGVHADKGYVPPGRSYTQEEFTADIKGMRESLESLLGSPVQHVSGICSTLDWAKAAIDAGYVFTTGGVGYSAMSMPEEMRPEELTACENPGSCHGIFPFEMADRIHPWRVSSAAGNWLVNDPEGELVILSSDGGIKSLYEQTIDPSVHGDNAYTQEDITEAVRKVEEAISLSDPEKVNILYFSLSIGAADVDTVFYNAMFKAFEPYIEDGRLEYKTMNEMFEAYVSRD